MCSLLLLPWSQEWSGAERKWWGSAQLSDLKLSSSSSNNRTVRSRTSLPRVSSLINSIKLFIYLSAAYYYYALPPPLGYGALSDDVRLTSVRRPSVAYIGYKSRTERHRKTKIGTEVGHVTRDSDTTFKVKRRKVNLQGWVYCGGLRHSLIVMSCKSTDTYATHWFVHYSLHDFHHCYLRLRRTLCDRYRSFPCVCV